MKLSPEQRTLVGYARVSSVGQSLDVQLGKLAHCQKVFQEKKSGASDQRQELKSCLEYVREGDTLVVTRLDRLARSTLHLCQIAAALERKGVSLQVIDQNIDTGSATGRLLFNMLGAIAQFETELRAERQLDGIQKAKERGIRFGRSKSLRRLKLRAVRSSDAPSLRRLWMDELVRKHLGGPISPAKAKQRAKEIIGKAGYFCVTLRESGAIMGVCSLDRYRTGDIQISYEFLPETWGNGFGAEPIEAVLAWGFKHMDLDHIIAVTQKTNVRSRSLLERVGMSIVNEFTEFNELQVMYSLRIDRD